MSDDRGDGVSDDRGDGVGDGAGLAARMREVIEPLHTVLYFGAEVHAELEALGLEPRGQGYVVSRAAPLGPVGPGLAAATFYVFAPRVFAQVLPASWEQVPPAEALAARARGIERVFTRVGAPTDDLTEATELARRAADACDLAARPLGAANAGVAPPGTPFADLWQALTVLREHRGDGHLAVLLTHDVGPVEALALYAAWQHVVSERFLRRSRAWGDDAWDDAVAGLAERGWLDRDGQLTDDGHAARDRIERRTDELATHPWTTLGAERTARLHELLRGLVAAVATDVFPRDLEVPAPLAG